MKIRKILAFGALGFTASSLIQSGLAADFTPTQIDAMKQQIVEAVNDRSKQAQVMNDMIFSFGELGFQEFETSAYITNLLLENGFEVAQGMAGIPTAWMATWGSGEPVIALGSDIDGIPKASQKPGVGYRDPIIEGAPGHGEGHNSGQVVNIIAALTLRDFMLENDIKGTIKIWPGVAEEQLGTKAYYVREGYFEGVDAVLFSHVANNLGTAWGGGRGNGLVSVQYDFEGESAHSAGAPWRGRSAADAVELMNIGMNYRREHLRLSQRIHSVVVDGGDQPNVVPSKASIWYFLREADYPAIKSLWEVGNSMAEGAALMSNTTWSSTVLGTAWPGHFNRPIAESAYANAQLVGLPEWSDADLTLAKAVQAEIGVAEEGLATELSELRGQANPEDNTGGGSDDIGDISWNVPTIVLRYPSNIPNLPGHNWVNSIAMATPIAHKGIIAGAKVQALTLFDLMIDPELLGSAWEYFDDVQNAEESYEPLLRVDDEPAIHLNEDIMAKFRPQMREFYYDPERYDTYLDQLGITYPTVR